MTLRESDDRIVPQQPEFQSGGEKPGNAGAGKAVRISRDPDRTSTVLRVYPVIVCRKTLSLPLADNSVPVVSCGESGPCHVSQLCVMNGKQQKTKESFPDRLSVTDTRC